MSLSDFSSRPRSCAAALGAVFEHRHFVGCLLHLIHATSASQPTAASFLRMQRQSLDDERLLETISANSHLPPVSLLDSIVAATLAFSGGERKMKDDLTLVVARGH